MRLELGLDKSNFYLYGHSWGGILAIEYALKHQNAIKGLIISNMMSSIPAYNQYAEDVLMPQIDPAVLAKIKAFEAAEDYANPEYMGLLVEHHDVHHILRKPAEQWPAEVNSAFERTNPSIYIPMQGPSELGASGKLLDWDRSGELAQVTVPTLVNGAHFDSMDPGHMEWMAGQFPNGYYLNCPQGSHMAMHDDPDVYFEGLNRFVQDVDSGNFSPSGRDRVISQ